MSGSGLVALRPGPATELAAELWGAAADLDAAAGRTRGLLADVEVSSRVPMVLEDVAGWSRRTARELDERIERIVRLDGAATRVPVAGGSATLHLDARGVADVDELLASLSLLGLLPACPVPGDLASRHSAVSALPANVVARLARQAPRALGGADGVGFAVRDRANRVLLGREIRRLARLGPDADEDARRLLADLRRWRRDRDLAIVTLDPASGRVALARGDLDAATHVTAIVPGAGASIERLSRRHTGWLDDLHAATSARLEADGRDGGLATVLWLDYAAPARLVPDAALPSAASAGAASLAGFLDGVAAVAEREQVTTIGHSYGSVVLGRALAEGEGPLATDRLVALGSPGMGVQLSRELGLRDDQRLYAATLAGDPIQAAGTANAVTGDLGRAVHGPDPRRLRAATTVELPTHDLGAAPWGGRHMQYLDPGSGSLATIADLVAGAGRATAPAR